jgi:Tol biopolymer transport system component
VTRNGGFAPFESPDGQYVYYAKGRSLPGLWRVPVNGGEETPVLEQLRTAFWGYWAVRDEGIYFVDDPGGDSRPGIYLFRFASRETTRLAVLDKRPIPGDSAFAVSPDGRYIVYTQVDQSGSDIMMAESATRW